MKRVGLLLAAVAGLAVVIQQAGAISTSDAGPVAAIMPVQRPGQVPLVKQAFRNNCETAALSMLLAAAGTPVDQRTLQLQLSRSGTLDPIIGADGIWTWGAPDQGFVGRVRGGGSAGGFGVYQGPIRRLAARHGLQLTNLARVNVAEIVRRLGRGRPIMVWIGLSEGPYRRWLTPQGRLISVNLGEHTVVLTGIRGQKILVNDPINGGRREWSIIEFTEKWNLLGQRALGM